MKESTGYAYTLVRLGWGRFLSQVAGLGPIVPIVAPHTLYALICVLITSFTGLLGFTFRSGDLSFMWGLPGLSPFSPGGPIFQSYSRGRSALTFPPGGPVYS